MKILRRIAAIALAATLVCCTEGSSEMDNYGDNNSGTSGGTTTTNASDETTWIDEQLSYYYLYNEEYNSMSRDLSLDYDDFLETTLLSMTTNVYDKKLYSDGNYSYYYIFSYVERTPVAKSRLGVEYSTGYGFAALQPYVHHDQVGRQDVYTYYLVPTAIYPDSPATNDGLTRGATILKVNGVSVSLSNYADLYFELLSPTSPSTTLTLYTGEWSDDTILYNTDQTETITLNAESVRNNPILKSELLDLTGDGTKETGYLVYYSFDTTFQSELLAELEKFSTAGVSKIILDLRDNLGGYTSLADILSSTIAGVSNNSTKLYYYAFNPTITAKKYVSGMTYDSSNEKFYDNATVMSSQYRLNLSQKESIYCLVNYNTASASEMTINCLEGLDYEVTIIGEDTRGKNVGMYVLEKTIGEYDYSLVPITFEISNAKDEGGYDNGMSVDYEVSDSYFDFGSDNDYPFICAKQLINGTYTPSVALTKSGLSTRGATSIGESVHSGRSPHGALEIVAE